MYATAGAIHEAADLLPYEKEKQKMILDTPAKSRADIFQSSVFLDFSASNPGRHEQSHPLLDLDQLAEAGQFSGRGEGLASEAPGDLSHVNISS